MTSMLSKKFRKKRKKRVGNPDWGHSGANSTGISGNPSGVPSPNKQAPDPLFCTHTKRLKQYPKRGNPALTKGCASLEGAGRPKGRTNKYTISDLVDAVLKEEEKQETTLLVHFVREAYKSNRTLNDLMKKLLPDLKAMEVSTDPDKPFQLIINVDPTIPTQEPEADNEEE